MEVRTLRTHHQISGPLTTLCEKKQDPFWAVSHQWTRPGAEGLNPSLPTLSQMQELGERKASPQLYLDTQLGTQITSQVLSHTMSDGKKLNLSLSPDPNNFPSNPPQDGRVILWTSIFAPSTAANLVGSSSKSASSSSSPRSRRPVPSAGVSSTYRSLPVTTKGVTI
jgi:hypothetical protein